MAPAPGRSATATTAAEAIWGAIVFTDIVGFTEFTALEGDEQALALLRTQEDLVNDVLPSDARVVKELGDGLLLFFPDSDVAVAACVAILDGFERAATADEMPLWVRAEIGRAHV